MFSIVINLAVSALYTFEEYRAAYGSLFLTIEAVTVAFFAIDYVFRLLTTKYKYPKFSEGRAFIKYIFSFGGIDMLPIE